jgi:hypothetical protein
MAARCIDERTDVGDPVDHRRRARVLVLRVARPGHLVAGLVDGDEAAAVRPGVDDPVRGRGRIDLPGRGRRLQRPPLGAGRAIDGDQVAIARAEVDRPLVAHELTRPVVGRGARPEGLAGGGIEGRRGTGAIQEVEPPVRRERPDERRIPGVDDPRLLAGRSIEGVDLAIVTREVHALADDGDVVGDRCRRLVAPGEDRLADRSGRPRPASAGITTEPVPVLRRRGRLRRARPVRRRRRCRRAARATRQDDQ